VLKAAGKIEEMLSAKLQSRAGNFLGFGASHLHRLACRFIARSGLALLILLAIASPVR
jgi:hypothetical protein